MDVHVNRLNKAKNLTITALTNVQEVVPLIKKIILKTFSPMWAEICICFYQF